MIRDGDSAVRVIEDADCAPHERTLRDINVGVYACDATFLRQTLRKVGKDNAQNEIYLTDIVAAASQKHGARIVDIRDLEEIQGVNDRLQLAEVEVFFRHRAILAAMERGVVFQDPNTTILGADVSLADDCVIGVGVQLYGRTQVGSGAIIEGPSFLRDTTIGPHAHIYSFSHLENAEVGSEARVGPFARLRPGTQMGEASKVGNFVEMKKTRLGPGAKASHLSYLGDADIGESANIGAGTITCNYDGVNKHRTTIGKGVFVGSNSTLVAPLELADGTYVGAGVYAHRIDRTGHARSRPLTPGQQRELRTSDPRIAEEISRRRAPTRQERQRLLRKPRQRKRQPERPRRWRPPLRKSQRKRQRRSRRRSRRSHPPRRPPSAARARGVPEPSVNRP